MNQVVRIRVGKPAGRHVTVTDGLDLLGLPLDSQLVEPREDRVELQDDPRRVLALEWLVNSTRSAKTMLLCS
ncbi:hypothetical protein [Ornithinimicrobium pekingense]|uniref:hypothetical protein n=1 Tax=Ornithinimicrobium pekingense TaxID=384677 RepID=UPI0006844DF2|nr:hypothetical protein [Ornithinimicrobium pekingense]